MTNTNYFRVKDFNTNDELIHALEAWVVGDLLSFMVDSINEGILNDLDWGDLTLPAFCAEMHEIMNDMEHA